MKITTYIYILLVVGDCYIENEFTGDTSEEVLEHCKRMGFDLLENGELIIEVYKGADFIPVGKWGEQKVYLSVRKIEISC